MARAVAYVVVTAAFLGIAAGVELACTQHASVSQPQIASPLPAPVHISAEVLWSLSMDQRRRRLWPVVQEVATRYGLDPALVMAVVETESRFHPLALSSKGAAGLMQIRPTTAKHLGLTNPFDPVKNLEAGVRYLAWLKQRFGGDIRLALAAYNAGPGRVLAAGGIPPIPQTQRYVARVLRRTQYYRWRFQALARR